MSNTPKPRKEMLSKDYKAPKTPKGSHVELEGGRLISSPTFTTSAKRQEAIADKRKSEGHYYGARVGITEGTQKPSGLVDPKKKSHTSSRTVRPLTNDQGMIYSPLGPDPEPEITAPTVIPLTDRQSRLVHRHKKN
ncbi:hypothetical protein OAK87_01350 [bacterium]|nr:hypothetical protein [bacterium]